MHAVILAGGLGTRLRPLVEDRPKPMAAIDGRPFLEYLILQLRRHGFRRIVLCTGHLGSMVEEHFGSGEAWDVMIDYSREEEPLGTAGALKLAEPLLEGERWLVMNGDSFFGVALNRLLDGHAAAAALASVALAQVDDPARYGSVRLGPRNEVISFAEKCELAAGGLINGGIYVLERAVLESVPHRRAVSLERDVFPRLVGNGLYGIPLPGDFIDIGVPADYLRLRDNPEMVLRLLR